MMYNEEKCILLEIKFIRNIVYYYFAAQIIALIEIYCF